MGVEDRNANEKLAHSLHPKHMSQSGVHHVSVPSQRGKLYEEVVTGIDPKMARMVFTTPFGYIPPSPTPTPAPTVTPGPS